jgi:hypothetical protein
MKKWRLTHRGSEDDLSVEARLALEICRQTGEGGISEDNWLEIFEEILNRYGDAAHALDALRRGDVAVVSAN